MAQSPAIASFVTAMNAYFDQDNAATDDLAGDIQNLNAQIKALQDSAGQITPEDQTLLDGIQTTAASALAKVQALAAQTPPVVPKV